MSIARTERIATAPTDGPVEVLARNIPHAQYHGPEYLHNRMPRPRGHGKFLFVADEKF
jgi:hypothetical protein